MKLPDETRLYRKLMKGYESSTRPILNASETLMIDFELTLTQITDLVSSPTLTQINHLVSASTLTQITDLVSSTLISAHWRIAIWSVCMYLNFVACSSLNLLISTSKLI